MWEKSEGRVGTLHHKGQSKWAEMVAWEMLDDDTKKASDTAQARSADREERVQDRFP